MKRNRSAADRLEYTFTNDILFKMVFVKHRALLKRLVAELLSLRPGSIKKLEVTNPELPPDAVDEKFCRLDVNMTVDGKQVDLEIQVADEGDYPERSLYYWAREYSSALDKGKGYHRLPQTIVVSILAFPLFDCREFHSEFRPLEVTRHTQLTDRQVLHYFELPKLPAEISRGDGRGLWLSLFKAKTKKDLRKLEALEVPVMKKAIAAYRTVSATAEFKEIERLRSRTRHNEASALGNARRKGRAEGRAEGKEEVARTALRKNMPAREIAELTGLPLEEIERLARAGGRTVEAYAAVEA